MDQETTSANPVPKRAEGEDTTREIEAGEVADPVDKTERSFRFWAIIVGLGITTLLGALENTVIVTAAPSILAELPLGDNWVWVTNAFFLCSAAFQPFLGQLCNVFGRRWVTLCIVVIFILGSGICGGATTGNMLIAGRAVQGVGSGGIAMVFDIIVSDLVPLRRRGNYIAVILIIYSIGTTLGPFIGGAIADTGNWRWVFYINLPVGGVSFATLFFFLHVNYSREQDWVARLKRIDYLGNAILVASSAAILVALTYAGTRYAWSSWHTLVPLLLGFAGFCLFFIFETSRWAPQEPVIPARLFTNRTSIIVAINTFLNSALVYWSLFFLPVYFQSVQLASPSRAGVCLIPLALFTIPSAAVGAALLSRLGKYKMIHIVGFSFFIIGRGLYTLLDETTPVGEWVVYQLLSGIGAGLLLNTLLPAFQAPLKESDQAAATASWNFIRTLGSVWGVAIPAAIFSNRVDVLIAENSVEDPLASSLLANGGAYQYASADFVEQFSPTVQTQIRAVYRQAILRVFVVSFAFIGLAWLLALFEKDVPLRKVLETEYGLEQKEEQATSTESLSDDPTEAGQRGTVK
ncbi:major facilitator superfamily domain-containing protein [Annulohypoxylon maeteangense]|uniref:major facilitator superfamily domain-containing protein n=1 Tax=Annulohypoxylon maeteangense TaxID=1927788 RepID=UPI0020088892|nr:major facilitator superfamily domain-containing protein [Annulohypoxylon maeteangense]KAI0890576.1 major facilitator superfamily domain-containing protein [Annulohypoxylon maeteangense]